MGLKERVKQGEWVKAVAEDGSVVIGRAQNEVYFGGLSTLSISLNGRSGNYVVINVNFWKSVEVIQDPKDLDKINELLKAKETLKHEKLRNERNN